MKFTTQMSKTFILGTLFSFAHGCSNMSSSDIMNMASDKLTPSDKKEAVAEKASDSKASASASKEEENANKTAKAYAALLAKDCGSIKDGEFNTIVNSIGSPSVEDRAKVAVKYATCKKDVELFEQVATNMDWDAFVNYFPSNVDWFASLTKYLSTGANKFPEYKTSDQTLSHLWVWVQIARRDGTSDKLCKPAIANRSKIAPLSAAAPLAFACANAQDAKSVAMVVPDLLTSTQWEQRNDGCEVLSIVPKAANKKIAKIVEDMSYSDPHKAWVDDVLRFKVRETCATAHKKIALAN